MNSPLDRFWESGPTPQGRRNLVAAVLGPVLFVLVAIVAVIEGAFLRSWIFLGAVGLLGMLYAVETVSRRSLLRDLHAARWGLPLPQESPVVPLAKELDVARVDLLERGERILGEQAVRMGILNALPVGVVVASGSGRVELANQAVCAIFPALAVGGSRVSVQGHIRVAEITRIFETICLEGSSPLRDVSLYTEADRTVRVGGIQLRDRGMERLVILVVDDVTDRRRAERVRREFIGNVSHELRTPITALMATSEMLADGVGDEHEQQHFVGVIRRHCERLNTLIKDLLVLSRLDHPSAQRTLRRDAVDIKELMYLSVQTAHESSSVETAGGIKVSVEVADRVPSVVMLHRSLMQHALVNLVDNAMRHVGEEGAIVVMADVLDSSLVLSVADNGIGISPEHTPRIFERFYRVDKGRSRQEGGSGIGLAIVRHVALVHGGVVSVESEIGHGSTFQITVPLVHELGEESTEFEQRQSQLQPRVLRAVEG